MSHAERDDIYAESEDADGPACRVCGVEMEWIDCTECGGDGGIFEATEESAYTEEEWQRCHVCDGQSGWYQCFETHPPSTDSGGDAP